MRIIWNSVLGNLNLVAFAAGFGLFYAGVAGAWSIAIANVVTGAVLMLAAAWPYLFRVFTRTR